MTMVVVVVVEVASKGSRYVGVHGLCQTISIPPAFSLRSAILSSPPRRALSPVESTMASGITQETSFVARSHVNVCTYTICIYTQPFEPGYP